MGFEPMIQSSALSRSAIPPGREGVGPSLNVAFRPKLKDPNLEKIPKIQANSR